MGNRNDIFSFLGRPTEDLEELVYDCHTTLIAIRHVCDAPDNHQPPEAALRGCAYILDGVIATLNSLATAEAQRRSLLLERSPRAHNKDLREFEERWGADAAGEMLEFIVRHYARAPDGESEGPDNEADDAEDERDPDWYLNAFEVGATMARQYPHTPIPDLFAVREALNKKWRAKGGPRPEDAREYVTAE